MARLAHLYLEQLKKGVMDSLNRDIPDGVIEPRTFEEGTKPEWFNHFWYGNALTMCGMKKLNNVQFCVESCLQDTVPGDLVECGIWRGGASILMRGVLAAYGITDRTVWAADSFQGLPPPPPASVDEIFYTYPDVVKINHFAVDLDTVMSNFRRYGLLDEQVRFLPGWFKDTLPQSPIEKIAVLRLDGDYYDSTMDILVHLYPKLSVGGYVIIDDWGLDQICGEKQAVIEYREAHGITDEVLEVDWQSSYWRKSR